LSRSLHDLLADGSAFQGYAYAYPHKTAYRSLNPPRFLSDVWFHEDKNSLFLYAHVPFCEMRCGFCNLFTMTHPGQNRVLAYLDALSRQANAVADALGSSARFSRLAIGGGTPTFLTISELERLFGILNERFPSCAAGIPRAIEASPGTVDDERVAFLKSQGITRVSLGVQSLIESEVRSLGRAQRTHDVRRALGMLLAADFRCVNVDLIYGVQGQTLQSWQRSLDETLEFAPQEIYLYPLYVRPLTPLDRIGTHPTDTRLELYRAARKFLLSQGYCQISMRLFRKESYTLPEGPVYCCQEDGMVGLGPGARSYTKALHYSTEYAVGRTGVVSVIDDYIGRTREQFSFADYGCELEMEEQKRRWVLKSLLRSDGLELAAYAAIFQSDVFADLPQLIELTEEGHAIRGQGRLSLTADGMELSDVIGPWLWSVAVREKMQDFALR
jgi:coproporphyrinogen III oxidase-like Fe-S oxidoreductase